LKKDFEVGPQATLIQNEPRTRKIDSRGSAHDSIVAYSYSTEFARRLFQQHRSSAENSPQSYRQTNDRSKRTHDLTSAIVPRGTSIRRMV
jgi:phospholipid N-methyltransferase